MINNGDEAARSACDMDTVVAFLRGSASSSMVNADNPGQLTRFVEVVELARRVWEDDDAAREFLTSTQPVLGGRSPLEIAASSDDLQPVAALLHRLDHALPI